MKENLPAGPPACDVTCVVPQAAVLPVRTSGHVPRETAPASIPWALWCGPVDGLLTLIHTLGTSSPAPCL